MNPMRLTISLDDQSNGSHMSPGRVRLSDLARFADDVKTFLQGDGKEIDANSIEVAVVEGSFALEIQPFAFAPRLLADLYSLQKGNHLELMDQKRQAVIERWQKSVRTASGMIYKITAPFMERPIIVSINSDYHTNDTNQWVVVERYITGEIQDLGGITRSNAHIKLPNGKTLKIVTDKNFLRDDKLNRLYKTAMLRIKAELNIQTRALRNAHLLEFVEHSADIDEAALERMKSRGASAWRDVKSASTWVDKLREEGH